MINSAGRQTGVWNSAEFSPSALIRSFYRSHNHLVDPTRMVRRRVYEEVGGYDDRYPLAPSPGFHSLVIPRFGIGAVSLNDAYLAVLEDDGTWAERDPDTEIKETT